MSDTPLRDIKRPNIAMIKMIEALGILLRMPKSSKKSKFKAPVHSNYDSTIEILSKDFYGVLNSLLALKASGIPNDIASELFQKTQEPGFDYEEAVISGGLCNRDVFNTIVLLLQALQAETFRIPVKTCNILLISNGSRSSYVALDIASHIHNHGNLKVLSFKTQDKDDYSLGQASHHISSDLSRRGFDQYKKSRIAYEVIDVPSAEIEASSVLEITQKFFASSSSEIIVIGTDIIKSDGDSLSDVLSWACWSIQHTVICVKSSTRILPFAGIAMSRKFLFCVKNEDVLDSFFLKCIQLVQPNDSVCLVHIAPTRDPIGDWKDTRFEIGSNYGWICGDVEPLKCHSSIGWNDESLEKLSQRMLALIQKSQVEGTVRIETLSNSTSVGAILCGISVIERSDFMIVSRECEKEVSRECIELATCSVILV